MQVTTSLFCLIAFLTSCVCIEHWSRSCINMSAILGGMHILYNADGVGGGLRFCYTLLYMVGGGGFDFCYITLSQFSTYIILY